MAIQSDIENFPFNFDIWLNCNGIYPISQIVMAYLKIAKVVMAYFQLTLDSVECQIGSGEQRQALEDKQRKKALEEKMDNVIWKMNLIIVVVICVVFECLLGMYAAKK
jgi:hypothetical protein